MRLHHAATLMERVRDERRRALLLMCRAPSVSALISALVISSAPTAALAQQPVQGPPPLAVYHPPSLALIQPVGGGSVPQDRPVIMFRFAAGDSTDPIEARSFAIAVDGTDRTTLFQLARDEVWGPLVPAEDTPFLTPGAHVFSARICSIRGACGEVSGSVLVATAPALQGKASADRKRTFIDLLLGAAKKLLSP